VKCITVIPDIFYPKKNKKSVPQKMESHFPKSLPKMGRSNNSHPEKNLWSNSQTNYIPSEPSLFYSQAQLWSFSHNFTSSCYPCRNKCPDIRWL